jgi:hypothetical protein
MTPVVTNKSNPRRSSRSPLDQPVATFENEPNLEIMHYAASQQEMRSTFDSLFASPNGES